MASFWSKCFYLKTITEDDTVLIKNRNTDSIFQERHHFQTKILLILFFLYEKLNLSSLARLDIFPDILSC